MRYLLLALMITLLPVRGWVGNAMAVDMAVNIASQQAAQTAAHAAAQADLTDALAMPEDCPMHAQSGGGEPADPVGANGSCTDCNTCELCLALASFTWAAVATGNFTPQAGPPAAGRSFSSAESASHLKPPIS